MRRAEGKITRQRHLNGHGQHVAQAPVVRMHRQPLREQKLAGLAQRLLVARRAGRAPGGTLRDHRQGHRLGRAELTGLLAKIDQAGRADALDVAAIGRGVEVGLENLALGAVQFQVHRRDDLAELPPRRARVQAVVQTHQLHGDGRRARMHAGARGERRPARAREGDQVEARVLVEIAVLVQQRHLHELRREVAQRHEDPVAIVRREAQPQ